MLDHEMSSMDINEPRKTAAGMEEPPLLYLARDSGYKTLEAFYTLEKAMLLLERKADVSRRGADGDTVLHAILKCERFYECHSKQIARSFWSLWQWKLSISTPKDMLILFMSAGADVFATNRAGQTPYIVAGTRDRYQDRLQEWEEALSACGYDAEEVMAHSHSDLEACTYKHQASKLMFEECCQQLKGRNRPPQGRPYDHLWEDVDIGLCECEDEDRNSDSCEEDEQSEDDFDNDIGSTAAHDDNLAELPSEQIDCLPATMEPRDELPKCTRAIQFLGNGVDLGPWSPVDGQDKDFLDRVNDQAAETGNCQDHSVNGSNIRYSDPLADEFDLNGSLDFENRGNVVEEGAFGFDELPANGMDAADLFDFDAYYEDPR